MQTRRAKGKTTASMKSLHCSSGYGTTVLCTSARCIRIKLWYVVEAIVYSCILCVQVVNLYPINTKGSVLYDARFPFFHPLLRFDAV